MPGSKDAIFAQACDRSDEHLFVSRAAACRMSDPTISLADATAAKATIKHLSLDNRAELIAWLLPYYCDGALFSPQISRRRSGASVTLGRWPDARTAPPPISLTSYIGRDVELCEIAALLGAYRFVTITGAGGIGKTQTALRVASSLKDDDGGTIVFVPLAPVADASRVVPAIAAVLCDPKNRWRSLQSARHNDLLSPR